MSDAHRATQRGPGGARASQHIVRPHDGPACQNADGTIHQEPITGISNFADLVLFAAYARYCVDQKRQKYVISINVYAALKFP
jgi:hypothetical protein